jgi:hypothetical protein
VARDPNYEERTCSADKFVQQSNWSRLEIFRAFFDGDFCAGKSAV